MFIAKLPFFSREVSFVQKVGGACSSMSTGNNRIALSGTFHSDRAVQAAVHLFMIPQRAFGLLAFRSGLLCKMTEILEIVTRQAPRTHNCGGVSARSGDPGA